MAKPPREISAFPSQVGVSKLRKRVRDLTRVLKKSQGNASKVAATERAIEATKVELADLVKNRHARDTARRYHMVRFFERKKAMRRLKRVIKDEPNDKEKLQLAEAGWYYVNKFPIDHKYIALFASEKTEKPDLFKKILQKVKDGQLPSGIENGDSMAFHEYPIDKSNITQNGFIINGRTKAFYGGAVAEDIEATEMTNKTKSTKVTENKSEPSEEIEKEKENDKGEYNNVENDSNDTKEKIIDKNKSHSTAFNTEITGKQIHEQMTPIKTKSLTDEQKLQRSLKHKKHKEKLTASRQDRLEKKKQQKQRSQQ